MSSIPCHIRESGPLNASSPVNLCGLASTLMSGGGHALVYNVNVLKSTGTLLRSQARSPHLMPDLTQVHIDLVGPLPPSNGYTYLLTCVDRYTRWPEAVPLTDITAETVAKAFITTWVARFGTPSAVTTDRGRQFESHLWRSFTQLLGTRHLCTTASHPCANGLVERLHRQLKAALKSYPQQGNWTDALPLVLLGIRTSIKEDLGCTAAQLVYGTTLHLPGSFFSAPTDSNPDPQSYVLNLQNRMQQLQARPPRPVNNTPISNNEALWNSPYVFIRHDGVRKPQRRDPHLLV